MIKKPLSYTLINEVLAEDIVDTYNLTTGKILFPSGHRLCAKDINYLLKNEIKAIYIEGEEKKVSQKLINQITDNWDDEEFKEVYVGLLNDVKYMFNCLTDHNSSDAVHELIYEIKPAIEYSLKHPETLFSLHCLHGYDDYTCRHSLNVSVISSMIGHLLDFKTEDLMILGQAGLLHDIGKIKIDHNILTKPGRLTKQEYLHMQRHTELGYEILKDIPLLDERILDVALTHHERLDGSGYPNHLQEENISLFSQIVGVADTFDAICSDRYYSTKQSPYFALQELQKGMAEKKFNPRIVSTFVNYMYAGFTNKKVRLSNGNVGEIVYIPPYEPDRPIVKTSNGAFINLKESRTIQINEILH
ncbi:HD-GYP domain-containing protein [Bacillus tianshenii]|nr:HD-GYP domain-containing protein [Bacillus tianshenii]